MAKLYVNPKHQLGHINPEIQGHFSEHLGRCIYEGLYVGENSDIPNTNGMRNDVVEALKEMQIPVLRWPGGCYADEYHRMDGIGPNENRKKMINNHWAALWRITASALMNSWSCAVSWAARPTSTAMWAAALCRR